MADLLSLDPSHPEQRAYLRACGPWIQTVSGRRVPLLAPDPSDVHISDIAIALSRICRFTGHTAYSVAQHSVHVSEIVDDHLAFAALLHDASETYIGDVSSPLKRQLPSLQIIERRIVLAIAARFEIDPLDFEGVKHADRVALATERRDLLVHRDDWTELPQPDSRQLVCLDAGEAFGLFMRRFRELCPAELLGAHDDTMGPATHAGECTARADGGVHR